MTRTGWPVIGLALLVLAACKAEPDAMRDHNATPVQNALSGNNATSSVFENAAGEPAPKPLPSDKDIRRQLIGAWVTLNCRPTGTPDAADVCATDNGLSFDKDGSYAEFAEAGLWAVKDGTLILSATTTLPDYDEEHGVETPINPPRIAKWPMDEIDGDILRLRIAGTTTWWYRCPPTERD